jgi:signal transduction histidine kinase
MHPLLARQLRKHCPPGGAVNMQALTAAVDDAYTSFENDRALIERTLEVMSQELGQRNRQLAEQLTEKQRMMDVLRQANLELLDLNRKFKAAQEQLLQSEKMASIGQLAAGVAHEINNPIAYVHSNVGMLEEYLQQLRQMHQAWIEQEPHLPPDAQARLQRVRQEIDYDYILSDLDGLMAESKDGLERVKKIVQNLKDFSRVDSGEWETVDVTRGLQSTLSLVRHEMRDRIDVVCELAELPEVECMLSQLNQVFMNLLVNAAHAISGKGTITIRTGVQDQEVWLQFSDTGQGIAPEVLPRIFDAFFTTKPVGVGTGLGLSLAYSTVHRHHGRIAVQSTIGQGTTFTIHLPLRQPVEQEAAKP